MKKMLIALQLVPLLSFAQIYQWTDTNGSVHFSDKPTAGAKEIILPKTPVYSSPDSKESPSRVRVKKQRASYSFLRIENPKNEETVRNNQGAATVAIAIKPGLQPGNAVQLIVDGAPLGEPQESLVFQVRELYRGSHTIAAQVVDSSGDVIISSDPITIFVHRPRVNMIQRAP